MKYENRGLIKSNDVKFKRQLSFIRFTWMIFSDFCSDENCCLHQRGEFHQLRD